ncbi:hypothetical protein [Nostoc sp. T09]|nr:hypothetical protein [Nostoc sp. T09]
MKFSVEVGQSTAKKKAEAKKNRIFLLPLKPFPSYGKQHFEKTSVE